MNHELPIERIMQTGLLTCESDTPLCIAAQRMAERQCSSIVVTREGKARGIWTEHDALAVNFADPEAGRTRIGDVMSQPVASLHLETPISEAALRFSAEGRRHFVVVDGDGLPKGILTQTDMAMNQASSPTCACGRFMPPCASVRWCSRGRSYWPRRLGRCASPAAMPWW
ncbi:CBS domain-containing protein [Halomonas sp. BC04]|uniref:CBS domain-containing protein n=1 Tax=Halomonas sp. BC04 TaxID=1403540 RepID=UPI0003ED6675|nr:CBS domain-containing protein [Halomonas sp. BC04]EWH03509.1 hypothetical protein Q427_03040 [Halomonas sp. BC04]